MTRKDFEALAVVAGSMLLPLPLHDRLVNKLAEVCESRNPRFSKGSFTCAAAAARKHEAGHMNRAYDTEMERYMRIYHDDLVHHADPADLGGLLTVEGGE